MHTAEALLFKIRMPLAEWVAKQSAGRHLDDCQLCQFATPLPDLPSNCSAAFLEGVVPAAGPSCSMWHKAAFVCSAVMQTATFTANSSRSLSTQIILDCSAVIGKDTLTLPEGFIPV